MERLLSVTELADRLGLAKATIYKRTCARTIPFIRIGNRPRFKESDIERWLNEQTVEPVSGGKGK
ncbi:MAG: helix-turn-helix domain-containing protein [Spirochaetia bacterium]|jgi:excisionase family DNA binding protein